MISILRGLLVGTVLVAGQVRAQAVSEATKLPFGIYKVNPNCTFFGAGAQKVRITQKAKILNLLPYSSKGVQDSVESIYLGSGSRKAAGTDGTITWTFSDSGEIITSSEKFVRVGSQTWPDLETSNEISIRYAGSDFADGAVRIVAKSVTKHADRPAETKESTCTLQSLANDKKQLQIATIKDFSIDSMQDLLAAMPKKLSLDQATLNLSKTAYTNDKLTVAQLKELASLELTPTNLAFDSIDLKLLKSDEDFEKASRAAFKSALEIANDYIKNRHETQKHYAPLFAYLKRVEGFLAAAQKLEIIIYQVEWVESEANGEGLLIIDPTNKEVLFIGSSYFS